MTCFVLKIQPDPLSEIFCKGNRQIVVTIKLFEDASLRRIVPRLAGFMHIQAIRTTHC
jgi:hypothetical protein